MALDSDTVKSSFPQVVPMVGTLALEFEDLQPQRAVMVLPDQAPYHNHVAGPHAGAMFTLGESASGALVFVNFGDRMGEGTTLNNISQIYDAKGDYDTALAYLQQSLKIQQEIDAAGGRSHHPLPEVRQGPRHGYRHHGPGSGRRDRRVGRRQAARVRGRDRVDHR